MAGSQVEERTMIRKLVANAGSNYANMFASILSSFILSPVLVGALGDERYGIWTLIVSLTGYFALMDFGINRAVVRYVSQHEATGDYEALSRFVSTTVVLFIAIACLISVATVVLAWRLPSLIDLGDNSQAAQATLIFSGLGFASMFPLSVPGGVLMARQEHTVLNKIVIAFTVIRTAALYWVLSNYPGLVTLSLTTVAVGIIQSLAVLYATTHRCPHIAISSRLFHWRLLLEIFKYSSHSAAISFSSRIIQFTDEIVIAGFLTVAMVTPYSFAVTLVAHFERLVWAAAGVLIPAASQLSAVRDERKSKLLLLSSSRVCAALAFLVFSITFVYGPSFIGVWLGSQYQSTVTPILRILLVARVIPLAQSAVVARLLGTSRHAALSKINGLEAVSNLVLSVCLIRSFGLMGVAVGTLIPSIVFNGIALPWSSLRTIEIPLSTYFFQCIMGPLVASLCSIAIMLAIDLSTANYLEIAAASSLNAAIFCIVFLVAGVNDDERRWILRKIRVNGAR